jgi:hypothetical protein
MKKSARSANDTPSFPGEMATKSLVRHVASRATGFKTVTRCKNRYSIFRTCTTTMPRGEQMIARSAPPGVKPHGQCGSLAMRRTYRLRPPSEASPAISVSKKPVRCSHRWASVCHLHRHFHLCLVARLPGTRRNNGRVVVEPPSPHERLRRHRGNADVIRQELATEKGVVVSLRTVERAVKPYRRELEAEARATVRFETAPGRQMQIDLRRPARP